MGIFGRGEFFLKPADQQDAVIGSDPEHDRHHKDLGEGGYREVELVHEKGYDRLGHEITEPHGQQRHERCHEGTEYNEQDQQNKDDRNILRFLQAFLGADDGIFVDETFAGQVMVGLNAFEHLIDLPGQLFHGLLASADLKRDHDGLAVFGDQRVFQLRLRERFIYGIDVKAVFIVV
ncbi:Uncharacterised protein [Actinobacillus pleuropneumoniae]|nr:Uncharacterised protein [Actinobacillus pleuropneumoniae]